MLVLTQKQITNIKTAFESILRSDYISLEQSADFSISNLQES